MHNGRCHADVYIVLRVFFSNFHTSRTRPSERFSHMEFSVLNLCLSHRLAWLPRLWIHAISIVSPTSSNHTDPFYNIFGNGICWSWMWNIQKFGVLYFSSTHYFVWSVYFLFFPAALPPLVISIPATAFPSSSGGTSFKLFSFFFLALHVRVLCHTRNQNLAHLCVRVPHINILLWVHNLHINIHPCGQVASCIGRHVMWLSLENNGLLMHLPAPRYVQSGRKIRHGFIVY